MGNNQLKNIMSVQASWLFVVVFPWESHSKIISSPLNCFLRWFVV
jgi:hypothetical protein